MKDYKYCPICGSKLLKEKSAYACSSTGCNVMIYDNHIIDIRDLVGILDDGNVEEETNGAVEANRETETIGEVDDQKKSPTITTMGVAEMEKYALAPHDERSIVISIHSAGVSKAFIVPNNVSNIINVLYLEFNDSESPQEIYGGITDIDACCIADFVLKYRDSGIDKIIVQCEEGRSRSVGIAEALSNVLGYEYIRRNKPGEYMKSNSLCFLKVYDSLKESLALLKKQEEHNEYND